MPKISSQRQYLAVKSAATGVTNANTASGVNSAAPSEINANRPTHHDYQKQYLVKYSQLPTNEFIKLKLMAENFDKLK